MSEIIIYKKEDGETDIEVKLQDETLWLSQKQMAELFGVTKQNISLHIQNIYEEKELLTDATVKHLLTVQQEGKRKVKREIEHYNLDMIISVGYRVKSKIATQFRQWATKQLKEYIIKGFVMDDERLKEIYEVVKKSFGEKFLTSMLQVLIMIPTMKFHKNFLKPYKIRCTMQYMVKLPLR